MSRRLLALLVGGLAVAASIPAQIRIERVAIPAPGTQPAEEEPDDGVRVQMFESASLDRYLRKSREFLQREDYVGAIRLLQDVIEGRTQQELAAPVEGEAPPPPVQEEVDPSRAVFSSDLRLYRPVRLLCHELLAEMPEAARLLYQQQYEVEAQRAFETAFAASDVRLLEQVFERYFLTLGAGRALLAAADLQLARGALRPAILSYRRLLDAYPESLRTKLTEIDPLSLRVRIAICHGLLGERAHAAALLAELRAEHPRGTVRILGELRSLEDIAQADWFAATPAAATGGGAPDWSHAASRSDDPLLPLWELRFTSPSPYRGARASNGQIVRINGGGGGAVPIANQHGPGTFVEIGDESIFVMDHYRVRELDPLSGSHRLIGEGQDVAPEPRQGQVRSRIPTYDWLAHRVVPAGDLRFAIVGSDSSRLQPGLRPLLENELVALDAASGARVWSSQDWELGKELTILAAPTPHGAMLLVPVQRDDAVYLAGCAAKDGELVYLTPLHSGGTELARAPVAPVALGGGTAFVLTHAGVLAAVDAVGGELLWARRYERGHPYHDTAPIRRRGRAQMGFVQAMTQEVSLLRGFAPGELYVVDGRVIVAPVDGTVMLGVDGASGELLWLAEKPANAAMQQLVGLDSTHLYVAGAKLTCIDHRTGLRLWEVDMPSGTPGGRGTVGEDFVLIPGAREVLLLRPSDVQMGPAARANWRRIPLPSLGVGASSMEGPCNLFVDGPLLVVAYEAGIEVYADWRALQERSARIEDAAARARLLAIGGDLVGASEQLLRALAAADEESRGSLAFRLLRLSREVALAMAAHGARDQALAALDRLRPWLDVPLRAGQRLRPHWHLARLEVLRAVEDAAGVAAETAALYSPGGSR